MMEILHDAFIPGIPMAQPRPRKGRYGNFYNPDSTKEWKEQIEAYFMIHRKPVITDPVSLEVLFYFPRPERLMKYSCVPHTSKPDSDNLLKAVMDALTNAGVWKDDALVYSHHVEKYYSCAPSGARIFVSVRKVE